MSDGSITLPKWFLWFASGVAGLMAVGGVPWATWVTYTLIQIDSRSVPDPSRLTTVEMEVQIIKATQLTSANYLKDSLSRLEAKVDAGNDKLAQFQREFDRRFGTGQP